MKRILKEMILLIIVTLPFVYLYSIWNVLPQQIPTHFGLDGTPNDWSDKSSLPYLIGGMGYGIYLLMLLIPYFDPKKKIEQMGEKYFSLRMIMTLLMSSISIFIIYSSVNKSADSKLLFALIAAFYTLIGNYFQTLKPNYFIGIKTPWALENEDNWRKTHRLAGKMWVVSGLLIILLAFVMQDTKTLGTIFFSVTMVIAIVPYVYSYFLYWKMARNKE